MAANGEKAAVPATAAADKAPPKKDYRHVGVTEDRFVQRPNPRGWAAL